MIPSPEYTARRVARLRAGNWQFGHEGRHRGPGTQDCPRHFHHHCDDFCALPTFGELREAGINPNDFKARSRA